MRTKPDPAGIDSRPGFYYVSAIDPDSRKGTVWRLSGPYRRHADALADKDNVRRVAESVDPRSAFMAFGTVRSKTDLGPGILQKNETYEISLKLTQHS